MKMNKRLAITAVGSGLVFDDSFAIGLDENNKINFVGESDAGIFDDMWEGSPGPMVYAQNAVNRAWASTSGQPPDVETFVPFDGYW